MPLNEILAIGVTLNWSPEVKKNKVDKEEKNLIEKSKKKIDWDYKKCRHKKREKNSPCKKTKNSRFLYFTSSS